MYDDDDNDDDKTPKYPVLLNTEIQRNRKNAEWWLSFSVQRHIHNHRQIAS